MNYYPRSPSEIADTQEENLLGLIGELYVWMEALTDYAEPYLSDEQVERILGGGL